MPKVVKLVVIPLLLLVAVGAVVTLFRRDGDSGGTPEAQVIERLIPGEGDSTIAQAAVGIDLITGWDASLTINQVPIPDDQLQKTLDLGQITFDPGEGKVIEALNGQQQNCATATYWQLATGPEQSFTRTWCFTAL